jgi:hypothetical protein
VHEQAAKQISTHPSVGSCQQTEAFLESNVDSQSTAQTKSRTDSQRIKCQRNDRLAHGKNINDSQACHTIQAVETIPRHSCSQCKNQTAACHTYLYGSLRGCKLLQAVPVLLPLLPLLVAHRSTTAAASATPSLAASGVIIGHG